MTLSDLPTPQVIINERPLSLLGEFNWQNDEGMHVFNIRQSFKES